eukprot:CAMPEP_0194559326 /NCGR_PEP_ID=MMETSP0292-20121207/909_1 /TAXON_ID=39354 /ORGANISM="Heterosigma akashiwo, Strain CCMP2393" /LENGTH=108 /DNA_ID=CAMNT_0039407199 /DNA_START=618 /DNA_END=945 /DNA_ORIENTATION=-
MKKLAGASVAAGLVTFCSETPQRSLSWTPPGLSAPPLWERRSSLEHVVDLGEGVEVRAEDALKLRHRHEHQHAQHLDGARGRGGAQAEQPPQQRPQDEAVVHQQVVQG